MKEISACQRTVSCNGVMKAELWYVSLYNLNCFTQRLALNILHKLL